MSVLGNHKIISSALSCLSCAVTNSEAVEQTGQRVALADMFWMAPAAQCGGAPMSSSTYRRNVDQRKGGVMLAAEFPPNSSASTAKRMRAISTVIKQHRHHQRGRCLCPTPDAVALPPSHTASAETPYAHPACSDGVQSRRKYNRRPHAFSATSTSEIIANRFFNKTAGFPLYSVRRSQSWRNTGR